MANGCLLGGFEFAVDSNVGVLVEAGIGFHARFGLGAAFADTEIMTEETQAPFEGCERMVVFEGMGYLLSCFDEVAVGDAGLRPSLRKMVGVELEELASMARNTTDNDMFVIMAAFGMGVHGAPEEIDRRYRHKIAYSASVGSGNIGVRSVIRNNAFQTVFNDRFQMSCHVL